MATPPMSESEFLQRYDASRFPHPSVAVDVALVTAHEGRLLALLSRRTEHPFRGAWSLPGGFVRMDEGLSEAAERLLSNKADIRDVFVEQLYTFGAPDRDPRTRVVAVAHYALVPHAELAGALVEGELRLCPLHVPWAGETGGPVHALGVDGEPLELAFDHGDMLGMVVQRLRGKLDYAPIGFELLPPAFTLRQLQSVHETIHGRSLNKDSFRRRMLATGQLEPTGDTEPHATHRPAKLYRVRG